MSGLLVLSGRKSPARRDFAETGVLRIAPRAGGVGLAPKAYRKTTLTYAVQMAQPFEVDTLEGLHFGEAGDYLAIGAHGEMYPIDRAVFEETYEPAT